MEPYEAFKQLRSWLEGQIIGQEKLVERLLVALLADGHLLVEGAPGLVQRRESRRASIRRRF